MKDSTSLPHSKPGDARPGLDTELIRVLTRSWLDEWLLQPEYRLRACRQRPFLFFPKVHNELTRSWSTPFSAHIHFSVLAILFSVVDPIRMCMRNYPPLEVSIAMHLYLFVGGFAEHLTAAQKSSPSMRHFSPKHGVTITWTLSLFWFIPRVPWPSLCHSSCPSHWLSHSVHGRISPPLWSEC